MVNQEWVRRSDWPADFAEIRLSIRDVVCGGDAKGVFNDQPAGLALGVTGYWISAGLY